MSEEKTTEVATSTTTGRIVTIVTTRGEKRKIQFEGTKWSELKSLLTSGGTDIEGQSFPRYNLDNMKPVESFRRATLEHPDAVIPEQDFNLFLMPYKSKAGSMSRSEVYGEIKKHVDKDGDSARNHFSKNGKNYTQIATTDLIDMLESYKPGTKAKVSDRQARAVGDVVDSVKTSKGVDVLKQLEGMSDSEKLDMVIQMLVEIKGNMGGSTASASTADIAPASTQKEESEEERTNRLNKEKEEEEEKERKRKKKEEDDKLEEEMRQMSKGFSDVRL